jgi:hypothetical protein
VKDDLQRTVHGEAHRPRTGRRRRSRRSGSAPRGRAGFAVALSLLFFLLAAILVVMGS